MQESVSMHKSPTPVRQSRMNQAMSEEEEKERKRDRKDRGQEADGKKGKTKTYLRNQKKAYLGTNRLTKQGEEFLFYFNWKKMATFITRVVTLHIYYSNTPLLLTWMINILCLCNIQISAQLQYLKPVNDRLQILTAVILFVQKL